MTKTLVAYFSTRGVTKGVAEKLAQATDADLYEIKPAVPYTDDDLNWMDKNARSTIEMQSNNSRPEIIKDDPHIENYNTIYLGFPIWWYLAPTIVNTFLEAYDFSHKKIILFATSGGSGLGKTLAYLRLSVADSAKMIEGKLLNKNCTVEELKEWVKTL